MASSMDVPVHDVGPLLEIQEYSMVWFLALIGFALVIVLWSIKQMRFRNTIKELDERKVRYETFCNIDLNHSKAAAYEIGKQGAFFAQDNEEILNAYHKLFKCLEPYKYAPKVKPMDEECLALYEAYYRMIIV